MDTEINQQNSDMQATQQEENLLFEPATDAPAVDTPQQDDTLLFDSPVGTTAVPNQQQADQLLFGQHTQPEQQSEQTQPEGTSAPATLTPLQKYEAEHQVLLNKKREADQKLLDEALEKAKADLEHIQADRKQMIEENYKRNREEEQEFLENRRTAAPWVAAADMCNFSATHTKDVERLKRTMLRMKSKTLAAPTEEDSS